MKYTLIILPKKHHGVVISYNTGKMSTVKVQLWALIKICSLL